MEPAEVTPSWRKSSYSNGGTNNCVEVGTIPWRKSTYSNGGSDTCVEAAHVPDAILVRDTKDNGHGPVLRLTPASWTTFTRSLRAPSPR